MYQDTTPRFWYCLGLGTGLILSALSLTAFLALRANVDFDKAYNFAKDWQTLTAGLIALYGAYLTVHALREQDSDRRERKQYADRTALPTALVAVSEYLDASIEILKSLPAGRSSTGVIQFPSGWAPPRVPNLPFEAANVVRSCLETMDKDAREPLRFILHHLQIQNSRLQGLVRDVQAGSSMIVVDDNIAEYLVHNMDLLVRCRSAIPYARGDESVPAGEPSRGDMGTAVFFADIFEHDFPLVFEKLERRYQA